MSITFRAAQALFVLVGVLCIVFSGSTLFIDGPDSADANAMIATLGAGMGVLVIVLATAGLASRQRWAWMALWVVPTFFVSHVVAFGTWVPDGVLAALSVAALVATRPVTREARSERPVAVGSGV